MNRLAMLAWLGLSACAAKPAAAPPAPPLSRVFAPQGAATRALEAKTVLVVPTQPRYEFVMGDRRFRVGEGKWKIPEENPGWNRMYGWGPVVWVTENGKTRVLDLRADFPSYYVAQVFDDPTGGQIYLFLDFGIEGPAPSYLIWISNDRGEHWHRGADLPRPPGEFPSSSIDSFFLDAGGQGTAWLKLEASNLAPEKRGSVPAHADVYFRVTTPDAGRSWQVDNSPAFSSLVRPEPEIH